MNDTNRLIEDLNEGRISRRDFVFRALALGLSLTGIESILAACGGGSTSSTTSSTTLKYANWASAESATKAKIDQAIKDFQTQNNVTIDNIAIPFDQMLQELTTMTNGGNPPSVMELSGNWPYALGGSGALQPLNSYIGSWRNDAFTNSFEMGTYKGNVYAVPFSISPHGFWYSKDLMSQAGLEPNAHRTTTDQSHSDMRPLPLNEPATACQIALSCARPGPALNPLWPRI